VQGKAARAQAAVKKKGAAKGKATPVKPATRPAKPTAAARSMRASRSGHGDSGKSKLKKKAR
jgi:hypothetical protein